MSRKQSRPYAEVFHWALTYLLNDVGFTYRQLATYLDIDHAAVARWHTKGWMPQSQEQILAVIGRAIRIYRGIQLIKELDQKLNEFPFPGGIPGAIDYLIKEKGHSYDTLSDLCESPESLSGQIEKNKGVPLTIKRYHKGGKTKMVKYQPFTKLPAVQVQYEPATAILAEYAVETGMRDEVIYALCTIAGRYRDVFAYDDIGKSLWKDMGDWCAEYEKKANVLALNR